MEADVITGCLSVQVLLLLRWQQLISLLLPMPPWPWLRHPLLLWLPLWPSLRPAAHLLRQPRWDGFSDNVRSVWRVDFCGAANPRTDRQWRIQTQCPF